jgi:hypothetical protein
MSDPLWMLGTDYYRPLGRTEIGYYSAAFRSIGSRDNSPLSSEFGRRPEFSYVEIEYFEPSVAVMETGPTIVRSEHIPNHSQLGWLRF